MLNKEEEKIISDALVRIVQAKEDICSAVQQDCIRCPLNLLSKCTDVDLPEFDFENFKWLDMQD